jgi:hypothetical protein
MRRLSLLCATLLTLSAAGSGSSTEALGAERVAEVLELLRPGRFAEEIARELGARGIALVQDRLGWSAILSPSATVSFTVDADGRVVGSAAQLGSGDELAWREAFEVARELLGREGRARCSPSACSIDADGWQALLRAEREEARLGLVVGFYAAD